MRWMASWRGRRRPRRRSWPFADGAFAVVVGASWRQRRLLGRRRLLSAVRGRRRRLFGVGKGCWAVVIVMNCRGISCAFRGAALIVDVKKTASVLSATSFILPLLAPGALRPGEDDEG